MRRGSRESSINRTPVTRAGALMALLLLAGCAQYRNPSQFSEPSPSVGPSPSPPLSGAPTFDQWEGLRRPLTIPELPADSACPRAVGTQVIEGVASALGEGPVYPVGLGANGLLSLTEGAPVDGMPYWKTLWIAAPSYAGRVLVRARQLDGDGMVRFWADGQYGLEELRLPVDGWATSPEVDPSWRQWPSSTGAQTAGCYGYQIDGLDFTIHVVFEVGT